MTISKVTKVRYFPALTLTAHFLEDAKQLTRSQFLIKALQKTNKTRTPFVKEEIKKTMDQKDESFTIDALIRNPGLDIIPRTIFKYLKLEDFSNCRLVNKTWKCCIDGDKYLENVRLRLFKQRKWFKCEFCHKVFPHYQQVFLHKKVHIFEKPYRCDPCGISYRTFGTLQKHKRSTSHIDKVNRILLWHRVALTGPWVQNSFNSSAFC